MSDEFIILSLFFNQQKPQLCFHEEIEKYQQYMVRKMKYLQTHGVTINTFLISTQKHMLSLPKQAFSNILKILSSKNENF